MKKASHLASLLYLEHHFQKKKKKKLEKQTNKKTTNVQSCLIISEKKGKMTSDNKMIFKIPLTYSFSFIPVHPNVLCNFI